MSTEGGGRREGVLACLPACLPASKGGGAGAFVARRQKSPSSHSYSSTLLPLSMHTHSRQDARCGILQITVHFIPLGLMFEGNLSFLLSHLETKQTNPMPGCQERKVMGPPSPPRLSLFQEVAGSGKSQSLEGEREENTLPPQLLGVFPLYPN